MEFVSRYTAKTPDPLGFVEYDQAEHAVWKRLYERQMKIMPRHACREHINGLSMLNMTAEQIPQLPEMNERLFAATGWKVAPVQALISAEHFFSLLAQRIFPAATFIRTLEELDYVKEPDIFHELFGHCPMLTQPVFADFVQGYAKRVLASPSEDWALMQRLFWFTVEFGLIKTANGMRAYGGGILSSFEETQYCVDSDKPERLPFDILQMLRTPYRIDMLQPIYFVIENYEQLYDVIEADIASIIAQARKLGELPPKFHVDPDNPNIHILAC